MDGMCLVSLTLLLLLTQFARSEHGHRQEVRLERKPFHTIVQTRPSLLPSSYKTKEKQDLFLYQSDDPITPFMESSGIVIPLHSGDRTNRRERKQFRCNKDCQYGFDTDVEGRQLCKCKDPCKSVQCFGGGKCVPQKSCILNECTYTAKCQAAEDVCVLPKPVHTFMCEKLTRRYYFDSKRGRCRKFWGCDEITGNSFDTKKECRKQCMSEDQILESRRRKDRRNELPKVIEPKPAVIYPESDEFIDNHIRVEPNPKPVAGVLDPLTGCPDSAPYVECPYDPCSGCSSPDIVCFTSFCGHCQAVYINLLTGIASEEYAKYC